MVSGQATDNGGIGNDRRWGRDWADLQVSDKRYVAMMRVLLPLILALGAATGASAQTTAPSVPGPAVAPADPAASSAAAGPYSVTVPVAGTSDAQRNVAIAGALGQVLQQVAPGFTASADVLAQASGYVRDFRYQRAASGTGLQLRVDFDPGAVGRLVAANQASAGAGSAVPAAGSTAANVAQGGSGNLWVDGLGDSRAFAGMLATLRADTALHDVAPVAAEGDGVLLHVAFDQSLATVLAGLTGSGNHFTVAAQPHPGADATLHWTP